MVGRVVQLIDAFTNEDLLHIDINDGLFVFLSEADRAHDTALSPTGILRTPTDSRPLALNNAENKIAGGVADLCIRPVIQRAAVIIQKGFVGGRQLIQDAVGLGSNARPDTLDFNHISDAYEVILWFELSVQ